MLSASSASVGRIRRLSLAGLGIGVIACGVAPASAVGQTASCPGADDPFASLTPAQAEVSVVCLSNAARQAVGLSRLDTHPQLRTAARRHAEDMHARDYFDHHAPSPAPHGSDLLSRLKSAGYPLRSAGENLASGQATPRRATVAWLTSPGHCRNLLDPAFDEIGVGRAAGAPIWVQVLGTRSTPSDAGHYSGCDSGRPPSIASVGSSPASDADESAPEPKRSGVKISRVSRSGSDWKVRVKGSHAVGRTVTVRTYRALRRCVKQSGQRERCSTVPGARLESTRKKLRAVTTVKVDRRRGDAFVRVSHGSFERDGTRFAAAEVTRKLPS